VVKHGLLPLPLVHPYVEIGYAPRHTSGTIDSTGFSINPATGAHESFSSSRPWQSQVSHGLVVGVAWKLRSVSFGLRRKFGTPGGIPTLLTKTEAKAIL